jgi:Ni,Fe-hydrogenase III large subunit
VDGQTCLSHETLVLCAQRKEVSGVTPRAIMLEEIIRLIEKSLGIEIPGRYSLSRFNVWEVER